MKNNMKLYEHLQEIITTEQLTSLFQPIYATNSSEVYGYEALIRGPSDSPLYNPEALFDAAIEYGLLSELELVCRAISIARFVELELKGLLFINVNPMVFLQSDHPQGKTLSYLKEHNLKPDQVVIELSEKYPIDDPEILQKALIHYRDLGFKIAVDDLGAGYAGLKLWSEVKPDYVKIDRYFIDQCDKDPIKREFIKSILNLGQSINAKVIAEGIETEEEFCQLEELGISIYQGFLFARPMLFPSATVSVVIQNRARLVNVPVNVESVAGALLQIITPINFNQTTQTVLDYFYKHPDLYAIPVVKEGMPVGMILREHILALFSTPHGQALHENQPIYESMIDSPVIVEAKTRLDDVVQLLTGGDDEKLSWHFIIADKGHYVGIGSVRDLLRQLIQPCTRSANSLPLLSAIHAA
jgi:EAL domain-containing protein (putative c-di-GMP-specific phosphodiesterase class I)/CBS domain-containing protein